MDTETQPKVNPPKEEKKKRIMSEKQKEGLQKGMAALKAKREALATEKEERKKTNEVLKEKGLPLVQPPLKIKGKDIQELPKPEPVEIKLPPPRKVRSDKGMTKVSSVKAKVDEVKELRMMIEKMVSTPAVVAPVAAVAAPVKERVVEKVISGNQLLDKIFFGR